MNQQLAVYWQYIGTNTFFSFDVEYLNTIIKMSVIKNRTVVLHDLSKAAANARSEVEKLLTVLEGPTVADVQQKSRDKNTTISLGM